MGKSRVLAACLLAAFLAACTRPAPTREVPVSAKEGHQVATLAGGCFWCMEAVYERLEGVYSVVSGYTGGSVENPTYDEVCSGATGHAEAVQITYDPGTISYRELLEVFWRTHDPTTPNRQGYDVGTQYRSAIYYHDEEQKRVAEETRQEAQALYEAPIVTEIVPFERFYRAEDHHQDYYTNNPFQPYCVMVIRPKLKKLEKDFSDRLKEGARP